MSQFCWATFAIFRVIRSVRPRHLVRHFQVHGGVLADAVRLRPPPLLDRLQPGRHPVPLHRSLPHHHICIFLRPHRGLRGRPRPPPADEVPHQSHAHHLTHPATRHHHRISGGKAEIGRSLVIGSFIDTGSLHFRFSPSRMSARKTGSSLSTPTTPPTTTLRRRSFTTRPPSATRRWPAGRTTPYSRSPPSSTSSSRTPSQSRGLTGGTSSPTTGSSALSSCSRPSPSTLSLSPQCKSEE